MDLNAALILVRIVDKGSFTAAAQELGMTKATVSRRIAELERSLRRLQAQVVAMAGTGEVDPVAQPAPAKVKPVARKAAKKAAPAKKAAAKKAPAKKAAPKEAPRTSTRTRDR